MKTISLFEAIWNDWNWRFFEVQIWGAGVGKELA
jgi:hypothetical protein